MIVRCLVLNDKFKNLPIQYLLQHKVLSETVLIIYSFIHFLKMFDIGHLPISVGALQFFLYCIVYRDFINQSKMFKYC